MHGRDASASQPKSSSAQIYRDLIIAMVAPLVEQLFHPLETALRRVQINTQHIDSWVMAKKVVFLDSYHKGVFSQTRSLLQGFMVSAPYRLFSRTYRFFGQAYFERHLNDKYGAAIASHLPEKHAKAMLSASLAGTLALGEIAIFYPWDTVRVKLQNNDKRAIISIVQEEKLNLYNGATAAVWRNIPGMIILFGVHTWVTTHFKHVNAAKNKNATKHEPLSLAQNVIAGVTASWITMGGTNPVDVAKTRMQAHNGEGIGLISMFKKIVKTEGYRALGKGIPLKLVQAVPKFALPLIATTHLKEHWNNPQTKREEAKPSPRPK